MKLVEIQIAIVGGHACSAVVSLSLLFRSTAASTSTSTRSFSIATSRAGSPAATLVFLHLTSKCHAHSVREKASNAL